MKKSTIIILAVTFIIIFGGVFLFSKNQTPASPLPSPTSYEYYWGNGCPHCENVEKFLESWAGRDKIQIEKKEVWYNAANARQMTQRGETCGFLKSDLAVPLLVTLDGKCLMGDEPIIQFFKELK